MVRNAAIGVRVEPHIKEAAEKAAADDHRTLASLLEKLLVEHLRSSAELVASRLGGPVSQALPEADDLLLPKN